MNRYRVHFTNSASSDAEAAYDWIRADSPSAAVKWFNGLADVIESLETLPERCALARESARAGEKIRQLLYGRRPHVYRILYIIRGTDVYILHVRHSARQTMERDDIEFPSP
jgi:plasmid stabilization system protein ParE